MKRSLSLGSTDTDVKTEYGYDTIRIIDTAEIKKSRIQYGLGYDHVFFNDFLIVYLGK